MLYYSGLSISFITGVWHFFVPVLYEWYRYLPMQYQNLIVGIDYTNFSFSLLLSGLSLLLIVFGKKILSGNKELLAIYGFMTFVWGCRAALTFIEPWPIEPVAWAAYGQLIAANILFIMLLIPLIVLIKKLRKKEA